MQIGKWPQFRILGSSLTLLAQERQGFLGLQVETFKENLLNSKTLKLAGYISVFPKLEFFCFRGYPFRQKKYHPFTQILHFTTLQSMMNAKLSPHRFWPCHENGLIKTIKTIPHNLYVSFKSPSLYCGLG